MNNRYDVLDIFKLIAAIFVVGIHIGPLPNSESNVVLFLGIGRFAVPFFLLTSGFLVHKKLMTLPSLAERKQYTWHYLKRLFKFYLAWWLLYLWLIPLDWSGHFRFKGEHGLRLVWSLFKKYILNFFTGSTFQGSWYISATILGGIIVFVLLNRLNVLTQTAIGTIWLAILLIVLLKGKNIPMVMTTLKHIPNFLPAESFLVAVPFLIFGRFIAEYEGFFRRIPILLLTVSIMLIQLLTVKEVFHWRAAGTTLSTEQFIFVDLLAVSVLLLAINVAVRQITITCSNDIRRLSSFVYMGQFGLIVLTAILHNRFAINMSGWTKFSLVLTALMLLFSLSYALQKNTRLKLIRYLW